jgi:hypothetical protein
MKIRRVAAAGWVLLALHLASCAAFWGPRDPWDVEGPQEVRLEIRNQHFNEMVIYAMPDGVRHRIGAVPGLSTVTFELPSMLGLRPGGLRLVITPIGSREAWASDPIYPFEGDTVVLVVAARLQQTYWFVR